MRWAAIAMGGRKIAGLWEISIIALASTHEVPCSSLSEAQSTSTSCLLLGLCLLLTLALWDRVGGEQEAT